MAERGSFEALAESPVRHDASLSFELSPARCKGPGKAPLLVLLHGHAANEGDLLGLVPYLDARFEIVAVRAPQRIEAGAYAWFRTTYAASGPIVHEGEENESRKRLAALTDEMLERLDTDPDRVFFLGFDEGATMALSLALTVPERVAGVAAFGGRVLREVVAGIGRDATLAGRPLFVAHGLHDDVVPIGRARSTRAFLEASGADLAYREYPAGHQISPQMLTDAAAWLTARLDQPAERAVG